MGLFSVSHSQTLTESLVLLSTVVVVVRLTPVACELLSSVANTLAKLHKYLTYASLRHDNVIDWTHCQVLSC